MKKTLLQEEFELKVAKLQVHAQRVQHVLAHYEELKNKDCFDWENVGDLDHLNRQFINIGLIKYKSNFKRECKL